MNLGKFALSVSSALMFLILGKMKSWFKFMFVFTAASRRGWKGGLGVRLAFWLEVPPQAQEDGQLQEAQVEAPHGAAGKDRTGSHLCPWVFSGEEVPQIMETPKQYITQVFWFHMFKTANPPLKSPTLNFWWLPDRNYQVIFGWSHL